MFRKTLVLSVMILVAIVFAATNDANSDTGVKVGAKARAKAKVDTLLYMDLQSVTSGEQGMAQLNGMQYFMKGSTHSEVAKNLGSVHASRKVKTVAKDETASCEFALLKALAAMEKKAESAKADAIVDVESYKLGKASADGTKLECKVGPSVTSVALRGTIVNLKK